MLRAYVYVVLLIYLCTLCTGVTSTCGGTLNATKSWQTFQSPGYPTINYASMLNCVWYIRKSSQGSVHVESVDVAIEDSLSCNKDSISWMENGEMRRICGNTAFSISTTVSTNTLAISFETDSSGSGKGFRARYRVESVVPVSPGREVTTTTSPVPPEMLQAYATYYYVMYTYGKLAQPGTTPYSYFPDNSVANKPSYKDDKVWVIDTMNKDFVVLVVFAPSPMKCATDYVKILDGTQADAPLLDQWCDGSARTIRSTGTTIRIHFHTRANATQSGVYFKYKGDIAPRLFNALDIGIVVGGVIGFLFSVTFLAFSLFCMYRRRKVDKDLITTPIISALDNETDIMTGTVSQVYENAGLQVTEGESVHRHFGGERQTRPVHHEERNGNQVQMENLAREQPERGGNPTVAEAEDEWRPDVRDGKLYLRSTSVNSS